MDLTWKRRHCSELLRVDTPGWRAEIGAIADYLEEFGARTPQRLVDELDKTAQQLA